MSRLRIEAGSGALAGEAGVPADKSIAHRAVMLAAIAGGTSEIRLARPPGEDNRRTVEAMRALGVPIGETTSRDGGTVLRVTGVGIDGLEAAAGPIDCGNSGTTMRLLAGLLSPARFSTRLDGDRSLRARPMGRVATPLSRMGAVIRGEQGAAGELLPPLTVGPATDVLRGIEYALPMPSAQVKSAVLLAALAAEGATRVVEPAPSRDHTERMLRVMGAPLVIAGNVVTLDPARWSGHRRLVARWLTVPGDLSAAAFLVGAALLVPGSDVVLRGVGLNPTRTGLLDALAAMGARVEVLDLRDEDGEPAGELRVRSSVLQGARIEGDLAVRAIDELPLLAALAAHAEGETVIAGAAELRVKESDRIAATAAALRALGADVEERPDGMAIGGGGRLRGGTVESCGDHRIAMAAAVCALRASGPTVVEDTDNVGTSFPGFAASLAALGARIVEEP